MEIRFFKYLLLCLKRMCRLLFPIYASVCLLGLLALYLGFIFYQNHMSDTERNKVQIGIVGDVRDSYLSIGLDILENMDASRFSINFVSVSEEEAILKIGKKELAGALLIPEDFLEALSRGKNKKIQYIHDGMGTTLQFTIIQELAQMAMRAVAESEKGIYAMQDYFLSYEMDKFSEATVALNMAYMTTVLGRNQIYDIIYVDRYKTLDIVPYYGIAMTLTVLFLLGGVLCLYFSNRVDLFRFKHIGVLSSVLSEYLALFLGICLVMGTLYGMGNSITYVLFSEYLSKSIFSVVSMIVLVSGIVSAFHFLCFELCQDMKMALLVDFFIAIAMCFVSGFFYPSSFFPDILQKFALCLPTSVCFSIIREWWIYSTVESAIFSAFGMTGGLLFISMMIRKYWWKV